MHRGFIKAAAIFGAFSVLLGAFGAHAVKELVPQSTLSIFETGVRYQFYHVFALLITALLYKDFTNRFVKLAGIFFIAGIFLFSGSLYFLTYVQGAQLQGLKWFGAITPFGGLAFITGWVCLFAGVLKK
jgi:uncharacterized membrane protein YgdD (TMEM256/DUF423 family)